MTDLEAGHYQKIRFHDELGGIWVPEAEHDRILARLREEKGEVSDLLEQHAEDKARIAELEAAYNYETHISVKVPKLEARIADLLAALERIRDEDGTSIVPGVTQSSALNRLLYVKDVALAAIAAAKETPDA